MAQGQPFTIEREEWRAYPVEYRKLRIGPLPIPFIQIRHQRPGLNLIVTFSIDGENGQKEVHELVWAPDTKITLEQARHAVELYCQVLALLKERDLHPISIPW